MPRINVQGLTSVNAKEAPQGCCVSGLVEMTQLSELQTKSKEVLYLINCFFLYLTSTYHLHVLLEQLSKLSNSGFKNRMSCSLHVNNSSPRCSIETDFDVISLSRQWSLG
jgi:hypothetical protein